YFAARSFTEPPGFMNSALPKISQPVISEALRSRISGVLLTVSRKSARMSMCCLACSFERASAQRAEGGHCTLRNRRVSRGADARRASERSGASSMRTRFDVIVVGGGHNGLVCACYLAQAGLDVCVLERHTTVGGAAVTEEFHPGFRNSVASYTVSLLQRRIIDELALPSHGLRIVPRPLGNFVPRLEGLGLKLPSGLAAAQAAIAEHSRADAERYAAFSAERAAVAALVRPLLLEAPIDYTGGWREWLGRQGTRLHSTH